jgi:hypothetical protein
MESIMSLIEHVDITVECFKNAGVWKRMSSVFRDPYTLKSLHVSLVLPKLEHTSCVWTPFYDVHVNRVGRVQRKFVRYALLELWWTNMHDLASSCVMFFFDLLLVG